MKDVRRIWWYPPLPVGATVFEIGYGHGHFIAAGRRRGWVMCGIDPGHPPPPGCFAAQTTAEAYHWPSGRFDAVVAWQVLEHLEDPAGVLASVRKALKPGGYLVASMPNTRCLERWLWGPKWDGWRLHEPNPLERHRSHWTARSLTALLEAAGFRVERVLYQRLAKQLPGGIVTGTLLAALGLSSRMTVVARA